MNAKRLLAALAAVLMALALTACGRAVAAPSSTARPPGTPERPYAVGVRTLALGRGSGRPLPTTLWYPTGLGAPGGRPAPDAPVATGRFPLVLFSHGLQSLPELHSAMASRWAAAGFIVAAPAYPHTNRRTKAFSRADIRNQPADAWQVIRQLVRLDASPDDPFAGHLRTDRIGAAGHSAGGYTTAGLFTAGHSADLRAGIIIAGGAMPGGPAVFAGPAAALLFIHGTADATVPITTGRAAFGRADWPKAFMTLAGQGHGAFLSPTHTGFTETVTTTTDFLRWRLYDDVAARDRLRAEGSRPGVASIDERF